MGVEFQAGRVCVWRLAIWVVWSIHSIVLLVPLAPCLSHVSIGWHVPHAALLWRVSLLLTGHCVAVPVASVVRVALVARFLVVALTELVDVAEIAALVLSPQWCSLPHPCCRWCHHCW